MWRDLGIRWAITGKLLDAHCFEYENGPFEVICFPSPVSSAMPYYCFSMGSPLELFPSSPLLPNGRNGCSRLTHVMWISWAGFLWEHWTSVLVLVIQTLISSHPWRSGKVLKIEALLFVWNQSDLGGRTFSWKCLYFCQVVSMSLLSLQSTMLELCSNRLSDFPELDGLKKALAFPCLLQEFYWIYFPKPIATLQWYMCLTCFLTLHTTHFCLIKVW